MKTKIFSRRGMTLMMALFISSAFVAFAATPTVSNVTAKQRYPWNGMVDITCTVSGISGTANNLELAVAAVNSGNVHNISQFWVVKDGTNSVDHSVRVNGTYHLVWDSKADFDNQICSNMVVRVSFVDIHDKVQLWVNGPYWATTNIGAEEPWEYGHYFWWGDTVGYKRENAAWVASDGSSANFSFSGSNTPTYGKDDATQQNEGWITADGMLAPAHDAAHVHWGGDWRMPTIEELHALNRNCDWTWATQNGVNGYIVRGRDAYASASIFLPCTGKGEGSSLNNAGSFGQYWSNVRSNNYSAWCLSFSSGDRGTYSFYFSYFGHAVRPVQGSTVNTVTFDMQNGSGGSSSVLATYGSEMPSITVPTLTCYTFGGYYTGTNGSGTQYYTASGASARNWDKTSDTTLYAYWTAGASKIQLWENGPFWANTNIGAENPEDYGHYFWWGDTVGYKRENAAWVASDGSSANFSFSGSNTPTYGKDDATLQNEGWITADGMLAPAHDAAHVHWGGNWRMPTQQELSELNSKCDWTWTTLKGVSGYIVKGYGAYASASIFFPCAGLGDGTSLNNAGSLGCYWSSDPRSDVNFRSSAWCLFFNSSSHYTGNSSRFGGRSVRPVQGFTK